MGFCRTAGHTTCVVVALAYFSTGCLYRGGKTVRHSSSQGSVISTKRLPASKPGLPDAIVDTVSGRDTDSNRQYTIKRGDTLAALSRTFYGDSKFWKEIYQANREVITNPNALEPGAVIQLP